MRLYDQQTKSYKEIETKGWYTTIDKGVMTHKFDQDIYVTYDLKTLVIKVYKGANLIRERSNITQVADYTAFLESIAKDAHVLSTFQEEIEFYNPI